MAMNDPLHRRQTDTGSLELVRGMKPLKDAEQLLRVLHVEAGAVVAHEIRRRRRRLHPEFDAGGRHAAGEFPGIAEKVLEHRGDEVRVAVAVDVVLDRVLDVPCRVAGAKAFEDPPRQRRQVHGRGL